MSLLRGLFESRANPLENPNISLSDPRVLALFGIEPTQSGTSVSQESALRIIAVYRAVQLIAGIIGSLPVKVYSEDPNTGAKTERKTPRSQSLWSRPNPSMTRAVFLETVGMGALLWGSGFWRKTRRGDGSVALWPVNPVFIKDYGQDPKTGTIWYDVEGEKNRLTSSEMGHFPLLSLDGIHGLSPIRLAREGLGLTLATEQFGARFFGRGTQLGGILSTDQALNEKQIAVIGKQLAGAHQGLANAHLPMVLPSGLKYQPVTIPPEDAQFLETRKFQVTEIARLYGLPPHLLGDVSGSTSWGTGIAEQNLSFHRYTLLPLLSRIEQSFSDDPDLFAANQYMRFNVAAFLRGSDLQRAQFYASGLDKQWLVPNEVRAWEDLAPLEGGDTPITPQGVAAGSSGNPSGEGVTGNGKQDAANGA